MRTTRTIALLAGIFIAALAYFYEARSKGPPSPIAVELTSAFDSLHLNAGSQPVARSAAAPAKPTIAEAKQTQVLRDKFSRISDGRKFALEALNIPEQGGRFYASYVVGRCHFAAMFTEIQNQTQPAIPKESSDHVNVIAAFDRIKQICGQFTKDDFDARSGLAVIGSANHGKDILNAASARLSAAADSHDINARRQAIADILAIGDPLHIDSVGLKLSIFRDEAGIFLYFDGQKEFVKTNPPLIAAFYLLPCGMGLGCTLSQDLDLEMACASGGACYIDRFAKTFAVDTGGDPVRYKKILDSYASLLAAVKSNDIEKFVPK